MAEPTGIRIQRIRNAKTGAKDENEERILINNDGAQRWTLADRMITHQTAAQQHVHIYRFPAQTSGGDWTFDHGESILVSTGIGTDTFIPQPSSGDRPQLHSYMNRKAMVWNDCGDRVYRRNANGTFVTQPFLVR